MVLKAAPPLRVTQKELHEYVAASSVVELADTSASFLE
jgi:hypothetical protein